MAAQLAGLTGCLTAEQKELKTAEKMDNLKVDLLAVNSIEKKALNLAVSLEYRWVAKKVHQTVEMTVGSWAAAKAELWVDVTAD